MKRSILSLILIFILLAGLPSLAACDKQEDDTDTSNAEETGIDLMDPETVLAEVQTVMPSSSGRPKVTRHALIYKKGELSVEFIADRLTELTGLNFTVSAKQDEDGTFTINWDADSTLIKGLDSAAPKEGFNLQSEEDLSWFMLNSLAYSVRKNLGENDVYYTMKRNRQLKLDALPDMKFPKSVAYNKLDNENILVG